MVKGLAGKLKNEERKMKNEETEFSPTLSL